MFRVYYLILILMLMLSVKTYADEPALIIYHPPSLFEKPIYLDDSDDLLLLGTDDHCNRLALHGSFKYQPDALLNYQGLVVNLGTTGDFIYHQNNVLRSWVYEARPIMDLTLLRDIHLFFTPDFGKSQTRVIDAFIDLNYFRLMSFRAGLQKSLVAGVEELLGQDSIIYQSFSSGLATSREIGFLLYGAVGPQRPQIHDTNFVHLGFNDWLSFQLGLFNGAPDASEPGVVPFGISPFLGVSFQQSILNSTSKSFESRLFFNPFLPCVNSPWQNLGFGIATSIQRVNNSQSLPDLLALSENPIFSYGYGVADNLSNTSPWVQGMRTRIHPQFLWYASNFGIIGDWTQTLQHIGLKEHTPTSPASQDNTIIAQKNKAAHLKLVWNLTGEAFTPGEVEPENNFKPGSFKSLGALQLVFRLTNLIIDPNSFKPTRMNNRAVYEYASPFRSVQKASAYTISLHWIWNEFASMSTEFSHTRYVGGCSTGAFDDPYNPGCLTASPIYVYAPGSKVTNRPDEIAFFQRIKINF